MTDQAINLRAHGGLLVPELDGLRGIAILLVIICHTQWPVSPPFIQVLFVGRIGVDLFFVLSGYLITTILIRARGDTNGLRNFYVRRILRIWPLYFLYLGTAFFLLHRVLVHWLQPWPFFLFLQNFVYSTDAGPFLQPTWSLAVEEQFYLIWPLVALKCSPRTSACLAGLCLLVSPVIRFAAHSVTHSVFLEFNTVCRLDSIALGCLVGLLRSGVVRNGIVGLHSNWQRLGTRLTLLGFVGSIPCLILAHTRIGYSLGFTFVACLFGGLLILALSECPNGNLRRSLRWGWLRYCGRISFALYLLNFGIITLMTGTHASSFLAQCFPPGALSISAIAVSYAMIFGLATLSWHLFERPILRLKEYFR